MDSLLTRTALRRGTENPGGTKHVRFSVAVTGVLLFAFSAGLVAGESPQGRNAVSQKTIVLEVLREPRFGQNLLNETAWRGYGEGFVKKDKTFVCDNASDPTAVRGAVQTVELNQTVPTPLLAVAESAAENVGGSRDNDYSLYLDLQYVDGTPLWGRAAPFDVGTHGWQEKRVIIFPEKPVKRVSFYLLFRRHSGTAAFRTPRLYQLALPQGGYFDGVPCTWHDKGYSGLVIRDVKAGTDFYALGQSALGIECEQKVENLRFGDAVDIRLKWAGAGDRLLTLSYLYTISADGQLSVVWCPDPRREEVVSGTGEYTVASRTRAGVAHRLSRWPFAAIRSGDDGYAIGIDMTLPAVFRVGYHAGLRCLFATYDIALTPEKREAHLRLVKWRFPGQMGFRGALQFYYEMFPEVFRVRIEKQGLWMPFAKISSVEAWEDFGFRFKEGDNETAWDDAHGILTFRYTEPMTWWMPMAPELPRTYEAAVAEAERLAGLGRPQARAWQTSSFRDEYGRIPVRLLDTPWCNGAVWSMNSLPQIRGEITDFQLKWNDEIRERLYGPNRQADLDGEYIDSSEGYVTDELDFRRDHFVGERPLTYDGDSLQPAVFRGLIVFEYVRAIAEDVHGMGKYMMANGTPSQLCWLVPWLDVLGTETNWNRDGKWQPMSDGELLYRRALCGKKPYCFLMNTNFDQFDHEHVEKYMARSLAYGMFPGFFSPNASTGHYFSRPELYNRDRPLFKKYVPLCKLVAEAGWEPMTHARSSHPRVYVERFGKRYFTVFNDTPEKAQVVITFDPAVETGLSARELLRGTTLPIQNHQVELSLGGEQVAVLDVFAGQPN